MAIIMLHSYLEKVRKELRDFKRSDRLKTTFDGVVEVKGDKILVHYVTIVAAMNFQLDWCLVSGEKVTAPLTQPVRENANNGHK